MRPIRDINVNKKTSIINLLNQYYESGGFVAKDLGTGVRILKRMIDDKDCIKFLSFPACIVATGTRGVLKDLIKYKLVDVVITTCGTIDHDLARVWKDYYHGSFFMDDSELHKRGIHRLGNILVPKDNYGIIIEDKVQPFLELLWKQGIKEPSSKEIVWLLGKALEHEKSRENSIIYWAWRNKIPIFVPGIFDGAFGSQIWSFSQEHDFKINLIKDQNELADIVFKAKKTGALIIGGGISKHHTIWWNQLKDGLDYAVYITTAQEYDGSLSGARTHEAISWGKIKEDAKHVTINGDATVLLPLIISAIL